MKTREQINEALDAGFLELIKEQQASLAKRLGTDAHLVTQEEERADAERGLVEIRAAHEIMRELVAIVFK